MRLRLPGQIRGNAVAALVFYVIAHMVLLPTAWATDPCDPTTGDTAELGATVAAAAERAGSPCMFMEAGEVSDKYKQLMADVEAKVQSIKQPIMYGPGYDVRAYYRRSLGNIRASARVLARELEADFRAAAGDCEKIADLQAATAAFYMGPLKQFMIEHVHQYRDHRSGFDGLGDVYVDVGEENAALLSGPWKAILDPIALSGGQLRYNPAVEQVIDIQARSRIGDERQYLEALQLRLATSELANFATLDSLLDDGGKTPCVPAELRNKFASLRNPNRIVNNRRALEREGRYRTAIIPVAREAFEGSSTLTGPRLVEVLTETDPWVARFFNEESLGQLAQLEQNGAPQLFEALLAQESSTLSTLPLDARRRRVAEIAEQARSAIITRYIDTVLGIWEQREAGLPDDQKQWTGYNTPEKRKERIDALLGYMREHGADFARTLELPDVPNFQPGEHRDEYVSSVIPVALAAADLEDTAGLISRGFPPSRADLGATFKETPDGLVAELVPRASVAGTAGVTVGSLLTKVNGQPVPTQAALERALGNQYGTIAVLEFTTPDGLTQHANAPLAMRISPRLGWQILVDPFMDQYPVMEDQVPDNWFRRNVPGIPLNHQTRYGDDGTKAVQALSTLIGSGKPFPEQQVEFYVQLSNIENEEIRTQLRAMAERIGLLDQAAPTMERVLKNSDQQQAVFIEHLQEKVRSLPLVSQTITWDGQTALGMDWLNPDDEKTTFNLAQDAAQDRVDYYTIRNGRLVVDKEALAHFLPASQVDAAAQRMQAVIDQYSGRQSASRFEADLGRRRDAFSRLDSARNQYIDAITPDYNPHVYVPTTPEYQLRLNELRNAITGSDMDDVRGRVEAFWHDRAASRAAAPHRSLAHTLDYVVRKATQGEPLTRQQLKYLRDHVSRQRENWERTIGYSETALNQAVDSIESLADQDSVNAHLFNWSGDAVNASAKRTLRDFARERRAEIPAHFEQIRQLGEQTLQQLDELLNDQEELARFDSRNEALMQIMPIGEYAELAAQLRRTADQARIHSYVREAERNLETVTDRLVEQNPDYAEMHGKVRAELNDALVQASIRAAIGDVCETLTNLSEQEDLDDLRKNLLASVIRQAILQEFPQFETMDQESEAAFQDYKEKWQKVSNIVTTIVITALLVSYFIPGVNIATGSATPWIAGGVGGLFAIEAGSGVYSAYRLNDRLAFSEALGTATYNGVMLQDPAITEALRDERNGELMWAGLDLAFAAFEGGRLARIIVGAVTPVEKASERLIRLGPRVEPTMSIAEADRVVASWATNLLETATNAKRAQRQVAKAQGMLAAWKVSKSLRILESYGFQIPRSPKPEVIDRAYLDWLAKNHPDKFAGDALKQMEATKRISEVQAAIGIWKEYANSVQFLQATHGLYDQHWALNPPKLLLPPPGGPH